MEQNDPEFYLDAFGRVCHDDEDMSRVAEGVLLKIGGVVRSTRDGRNAEAQDKISRVGRKADAFTRTRQTDVIFDPVWQCGIK
jgi:hypothetical protein